MASTRNLWLDGQRQGGIANPVSGGQRSRPARPVQCGLHHVPTLGCRKPATANAAKLKGAVKIKGSSSTDATLVRETALPTGPSQTP